MSGYSHASHTSKVLKSSKARCGARTVLQALCARADFRQPHVIITKDQLIDYTGLQRKAVQRALAKLREEGCIKPIYGEKGGKGVPVTYELCIVGPQQTQTAPKSAAKASDRKAKPYVAAVTKYMAERGIGYGEARKLADEKFGIAA